MRFLTTVAGYKRTDHIKNQAIRQELNIFNIVYKTVEYQTDMFARMKTVEEKGLLKGFTKTYEKMRRYTLEGPILS
jgi:hypothetical protein